MNCILSVCLHRNRWLSPTLTTIITIFSHEENKKSKRKTILFCLIFVATRSAHTTHSVRLIRYCHSNTRTGEQVSLGRNLYFRFYNRRHRLECCTMYVHTYVSHTHHRIEPKYSLISPVPFVSFIVWTKTPKRNDRIVHCERSLVIIVHDVGTKQQIERKNKKKQHIRRRRRRPNE